MTSTVTIPKSACLILKALSDFVSETGLPQKTVAIDAGLKGNLISMMKKGEFKPPMKRVLGFKQGMPNLDQHELTAAILEEQFPEGEAQQAIIELFDFLHSLRPVEQEIFDIFRHEEKEARACGLSVPDSLTAEEKAQIAAVIKQAIQRESNPD